jgi:hypothetical protein
VDAGKPHRRRHNGDPATEFTRTFRIGNKLFEFHELKLYLDFDLTGGERNLWVVPFGAMLRQLEEGTQKIETVAAELAMLGRWVSEAPRKRFYRGLKIAGMQVLSAEYWFEDRADGEEIIDGLENSGHLARRILEGFRE